MLDIALVIPELLKYGGAERLLMECAARWQQKHRITIYSSNFNELMLGEHRVDEQVSLVRLSPYFEGEHGPLLNCVLLPKLWEQEIGAHDVYNTHLWPTHLIDLHPTVWYPHEPLRVLHDLRGDEGILLSSPSLKRSIHLYPRFKYDCIEYKYFEACLSAMNCYEKLGNPDRIVANSRFTASYLGEVYGRQVKDVVYPGVDLSQTLPAELDHAGAQAHSIEMADLLSRIIPAQHLIVTIGQLWPHKRIDLLIQACSLVRDVHLCIIGQGPEIDSLQALAEAVGLDDRVTFLEGLSNRQVCSVLQKAFAAAFVSRNEPFGIVALEAMAAGKPLIAVDEGGYTEILDESCACLVPARIDLIADKISWLRDHQEQGREMGLIGAEKACQYSWDRTSRELLAILEDTYRSSAPQQIPAARSVVQVQSPKPLFGVQCYCWYGGENGAAHWNDNPLYGTVTDIPLSGYYKSSNESTLRNHFDLLEDTGVHFVVLNLHLDAAGLNRYEKNCIEKAFRVASKRQLSLKLAVQLCPYHSTLKHLYEAIQFVARGAAKGPHYFRMNDKPVLYIFWTGALDGDSKTIDRLHEMTDSFALLASSTRFYDPRSEPQKTFGLFDGFSLFSPLEIAAPSQWETAWRAAYLNSSAGNMNLRIFTVSPGYDDMHLEDPGRAQNSNRTIDRDRGNVFQSMIDCALSLDPLPAQIIVSTFNEFHENTHINPSVNHGSLYIAMTRDLVRVPAEKWAPRKAS